MATEITIDGTPTNGSNPWIDSLVWGGRWVDADGGTTTIGYSFVDGFDSFIGGTGVAWLSSEMSAVTTAMAQWENVANVDFVETSSGSADLWYWLVDDATASALFGPGTLGAHEVPGYSTGTPLYGLFNYEGDGWNSNGLTPGGYGFVTLIHELGHGLGLAHPHDGGTATDASLFPGVTSAFDDYGDFDLNQGIWTTMSYNDGWTSLHPSPSLDFGLQLTPMALDIASIQLIYGANTTYHSGGDTYALPTVNAVGTGWSCIWDVGGTDTINAVGAGGSCVIDLRSATLTGANAGGYVSWITGIFGGFTIANGVVIENALGGNFSDSIFGNDNANYLDGALGSDTLRGFGGNDTYVVNVSGDIVTELAGLGTGTDTINVASTFAAVAGVVTYSIASKANVENLTYLGTNNFTGTGNTLNNTITGGIGNDILDGGVGIDTLIGGDGDDTYTVATAGDTVDETGGSGIDLVKSAISFSLVDGAGQVTGDVENLTLTGALAINGTGNALGNTITGNTGVNIIEGGAGDDVLDGGVGIDTVSYASAGSSVTVVLGGAALTTGNGEAGENDSLKGFENIIGSASIDTLTGDGLANVIDGGAGADIMAGLAGNDTYVVDNVGDKANELAAGGTDLVKSSVDFTLDVNVENLTYDNGVAADLAFKGTGNALANIITGGAGNDRLDGKAGIDTMIGGLGNDTYVVDVAGDKVTEVAGAGTGTDTIETTLATFSLAALAAVENLTYTGVANFTGTGNALANIITGGIGADKLSGGTGADTLIGGLGSDTYTVDNVGDVVDESGDVAGTDLVQSSVTFSLLDGAHAIGDIDNLTLTGALAINGTGNALVNKITGNTGANIIEGGAGDDVLDGGVGIDTVSYASAGSSVTVVLGGAALTTGNGEAGENDSLKGFENIIGSASIDTLTGDGLANVIDGGAGADIMAGLAGNDTYVVDNVGDKANELAAGGTDLVKSSVDFTLDVNVENLTYDNGVAADLAFKGTGNALANIITGGAGNDRLDGKAGIDTMIGGLGNDTYVVDVAGDKVTEVAGAGTGTDTIETTLATFSLAALAAVENLTYTGVANFTGTGNALANIITGGIGADKLSGGTGADTLIGGLGSDTYTVDNVGDVVDESGDVAGTDLVQSSVTFSLLDGAHAIGDIDNLTLTGALAINGTGNALVNKITGNTGANIIEGGAGDDVLDGGVGIDTVSYASAGSSVTVVLGGAALTTGNGEAGENDSLKGFENIIGSASIDTLTGDGLANVIDGGAGADIMAGLAGNDTYVVDNVGDKANELAAGGTDLVKSSVDFTLDVNVENLTYDNGVAADLAFKGTGNALANIITGGAGNDRLDGKAGIDTMIGGLGNDTYVVDVAGDKVTEVAGAGTGTDTIETTLATFSLAALAAVENLTYTGVANFTGTGNALANIITGGIGADKLSGGTGADTLIGRAGNDTLTGGTQNDQFIFNDFVLDGNFGNDKIADFTGGVGLNDVIQIDGSWDFATAAEVAAAFVVAGADKFLFIDANNSITLVGKAGLALVADDFLII